MSQTRKRLHVLQFMNACPQHPKHRIPSTVIPNPPDAAHDAKVNEADPPVWQHQQVAGVHICRRDLERVVSEEGRML